MLQPAAAAHMQAFCSSCKHITYFYSHVGPPLRRRPLSSALRHRLSSVRTFACGSQKENANGAGAGESFVITTPLYYVNAAPHMGSAYTTIAVDTTARFQRMAGKRVTFVTGTDEHGEKIALSAAAKGVSPQEHCDGVAAEFEKLWKLLGISNDVFIRTTDPAHKAVVAQFLQRVKDAGDIYKGTYEGYYCIGCEKYLDDEEMDAQKHCLTHRTECSQRKEENHFFKLSKYQKQMEELLAKDPDFVQPEARRNEVMGWVTSGLQDFSLSRAKVDWGIRVPWDPSQTFYVWTDALQGYLTAILQGAEPTLENLEQVGWPANVHVVGKDIIRFHAVMWPALLMSAGLPVPRKIFGHGFLTKDGLKMGKALGNVLDPVALTTTYGADAVRFFFMKEIRFGQDGDFSEQRFQSIVNASLANGVGNALNRTLGLLHKFCDGQLPEASSSIAGDAVLRRRVAECTPAAIDAYTKLDISVALEAVLSISGRANQYLEEQAPWTALKKGTDEEKAGGRLVLTEVVEAIRIVAVLLNPVTPTLSRAVYQQLGFPEEKCTHLQLKDAEWGGLQQGQQTQKPVPVFTRLEQDFVTEPPKVLATV